MASEDIWTDVSSALADRDSRFEEEIASIGERIRAARKQAGLNQTALAARVGVSQPAVATWESGVHDPRRLMIAKIAKALGVSSDWLGGGRRSANEQDKHAAAAYLRRPIQHTPVLTLENAARMLTTPDADPHSMAEDYIPVTTSAQRVFAFFAADPAVNRAFPENTLVVIDYADRHPTDGAFCLAMIEGAPLLRRWRAAGQLLEPASDDDNFSSISLADMGAIIGCAKISIRFH